MAGPSPRTVPDAARRGYMLSGTCSCPCAGTAGGRCPRVVLRSAALVPLPCVGPPADSRGQTPPSMVLAVP